MPEHKGPQSGVHPAPVGARGAGSATASMASGAPCRATSPWDRSSPRPIGAAPRWPPPERSPQRPTARGRAHAGTETPHDGTHGHTQRLGRSRLHQGERGSRRMYSRESMATIRFRARLGAVDRWTLLRLPDAASAGLPSRGQVAVRGTLDGQEFQTVLEPDGQSGHWMRVDESLQRAAGVSPGDTAELEIETATVWPEPTVPDDLGDALARAPQQIRGLWSDITPMARWEWVRWVNATRNPDTRRRRVEVTISKMSSGKRRPCCFDLAACTDPHLSRNGRLVGPLPDRPSAHRGQDRK